MIIFRRLYLLLTMGLIWQLSAFSQITFHHYLDSTFSWTDGYEGLNFTTPNCPNGSTIADIFYNHFVGYDSMDGYWWYKFHVDKQRTETCLGPLGGTFPSPPENTNQYTRIREDASGKIWFIGPSGLNTLLYDFEQPIYINDTIRMFNNFFFCKVSVIDTVRFGNDARARYWCACDSSQQGSGGPNYVIEGVGHSLGLTSYSDGCVAVADAEQYMICASIHGDTFVVNSSQPCAEFGHVAVGLERPFALALDLFWDSESGTMVVQNWSPIVEAKWAVYNVAGQKLFAGAQLSERIQLPNLSQGMYIFAAESPTGAKHFRFLKRE